MIKLENIQSQMRKGVLEYCILIIIDRKEVYPSDIIKGLKEVDIEIVEGTLYPLLTRLRKSGFLDYKWVESESGPPRKYYTLTASGKEFLNQLSSTWSLLANAVKTLEQ